MATETTLNNNENITCMQAATYMSVRVYITFIWRNLDPI